MEKEATDIFRKLKQDVTAYVEVKFELLKLNTYERTGKVIAVLSYGVVLLFLAFFATLFLFLALGLFLGELLGSPGAGFAIVVLVYLAAIGIIYLYKNTISNKIQNVVIDALMADDDNTNGNEPTTDTPTATAHPAGETTGREETA